VLGSSSAVVDVKMNGHWRRVAFSGDIGRRNLPILKDPVPPSRPDYVVMESTYGNRTHAPAEGMQDQLLEVIQRTRARGGKVVIPSFALERAQEIVYSLAQLVADGRLKPLPVYVDSPLTVNLTEVFRRHPECYDAEALAFDNSHGDPFGFQLLTMVESVDESKRLNTLNQPAVIISASGMCEAGRIVHHLRNSIEDSKNSIVIVGYQAQHTLGRRLVEQRPRVKIFGVERDLNAEVVVLNAFSAHADRDELLWWAEACGPQVRRFFAVHGDPDQCEALAGHLDELGRKALVPSMGQSVDLDR
jgi:metallo-beta-lactamase family protein